MDLLIAICTAGLQLGAGVIGCLIAIRPPTRWKSRWAASFLLPSAAALLLVVVAAARNGHVQDQIFAGVEELLKRPAPNLADHSAAVIIPTATVPAPKKPADVATEITMTCGSASLPLKMPASGRVDTLEILQVAKTGGQMLGGHLGDPGARIDWNGRSMGIQCNVLNEGAHSLVAVDIPLRMSFRPMHNSEGGGQISGPPELERAWDVVLPIVKVGTDHEVVFYVVNRTDDALNISLPSKALAGKPAKSIKVNSDQGVIYPLSSMSFPFG